MTAAFRRGTFGTGVVRTNGLALQQSGVVSLGSVATDSNFPNISLLVEPTTTNAATNNTFLDSAGVNTITRYGFPTQGSFTPYWPSGYWSNYFDDLSSNNLTISSPATNFQFAGDFTIEAWYWASSGGDSSVFVEFSGNYLAFNINPTGNTFNIYLNSGSPTFSPAATIPLSQWNHVALVRSGSGSGNIKVYLNGTALGTTGTNTSTLGYSSPSYVRIGGGSATSSVYISNLRIVNGTAVYTSNFTPPTTPLTAITNTVLLTCQDNRFKDNSTNNFTITATGTPQVKAFQPFATRPAYSASTYGGSGYFNGSTDYLVKTGGSSLSGDFTLEFWMNPTAYGSYPTAFNNNGTGPDSIYGQFGPGGNSTINFNCGNGTTDANIFGFVASLNTWYHVAIVRSGSTVTGYVNGVAAGTRTSSATFPMTLGIGAYPNGNYPFSGYITNFRIVNGTAVYTGTFTPPTLAPLTTAGSTSAASYSSTTNVNTSFAAGNTALLLNFANAGIYDAVVQNNIATTGTAQVSTTQYKWAPTSMKFNGSTDYLTTPSSVGWNLPGDFTVETWLFLNATGVDYSIVGKWGPSNYYAWILQYMGASGPYIRFYSGNSGTLGTGMTFSTTLLSNTWYHIAVTRSGSNIRCFVNGTQVGSTATNSHNLTSSNGICAVGYNPDGGQQYLNGYIQDLRITNGTARYTANFTPPTTAFPITGITYTPAVPDAPIIANLTTITNTSVKIGYMAPLLNGGSTITSYTAVSTPGGITGTSITAKSGTITVNGLLASNTYTFAVYATNAVGTSTFSASSKSVTTPVAQLGRIFILSDMDLALTDLVLLNTTVASGILKAKTYALATIYGSD